MSNFTFEEIDLIAAVGTDTVDDTLTAIFDLMPHIQDSSFKRIAEGVISKLENMSKEEFKEHRFKEKATM